MAYTSLPITDLAKPLAGQTPKGGVGVAVRNERLFITKLPSSPDAEIATDADAFLRQEKGSPTLTPATLKNSLTTILATLSVQPLAMENVKQCEALLRTLEPALATVDKALTKAATAALQALAAVPEDTAPPAEAVQKTVVLIEQLRELVSSGTSVSSKTIVLQQPLPEGLRRFESVDKALDILKPLPGATNEAFVREAEAALARDGVIIVRTSNFDTKESVATIITPKEALRELQSLPGRFSNRAFQSIPPTVFEQVLQTSGTLNLTNLAVLDGFAAEQSLPATTLRAGSSSAQEAALFQWLSSMNDAKSVSPSLAALLPVFSATSLVEAVGEFSQSAARLTGDPSTQTVTETVRLQTSGADNVREFISMVRSQLSPIESLLETTSIAADLPFSQAIERALSKGAEDLTKLLQTLETKVNERMKSQPDKTTPAYLSSMTSLADTAKKQIDALLREIENTITEILKKVSAPQNVPLLKELSVIFQNLEKLKPILVRGMETMVLDPEVLSPAQEKPDALPAGNKENSPLFHEAITQSLVGPASSSSTRLLPETFFLTQESVTKDFDRFRLLESIMTRCGFTLENSLAEGSLPLQPSFKQQILEILRLMQPETPLPNAPLPENNDQSLVRQMARQNIDTVLNRFESLQLLARQVATPEGSEQQILAVPIKIGGEWTELNVRFVNKQKKSGKAPDGHYTVFLSMAPALLGAIGATMEYTKNKNLSIALHFEHQATRDWFAANKNNISTAIGTIGVPSPRITLFMEPKITPAAAPGMLPAGASNTLFDVKA